MKKAVFIVAFRNFRDEEYAVPRKILESAGIDIAAASDQKGEAIGSSGLKIKIDLSVAEIKPEDFDAIVFVGGRGSLERLDNEISYRLIRAAANQNKILAAICIAPVILAKAGALANKKATVWPTAVPICQEPIKILEENGAIVSLQKAERDQNIITANGPQASEEFGKQILEMLK